MTHWPLIATVVGSIFLASSTVMLLQKRLLNGFWVFGIWAINIAAFVLAWAGVYAYFFTQADARNIAYVAYSNFFASGSIVLLAVALAKRFSETKTVADLRDLLKSIPWVLIYLIVVVAAHGLTIWSAITEGGLVLFLYWWILALPLFIPGFFVGIGFTVHTLRAQLRHRAVRMTFGLAAVALPFWEWYLLATLPSGYGGG